MQLFEINNMSLFEAENLKEAQRERGRCMTLKLGDGP